MMRDPIVVDFEGFANTRPVLAGVLVDRTRMRQAEEWCRGHGNRLVDFVRLAGLDVPDDYGDQRVTAALRRVMEQSSRRARFGGYPQGVKDAWSAVLRHNRCDCRWARMFVRWGGSRSHGAGSGRRSSERGAAA